MKWGIRYRNTFFLALAAVSLLSCSASLSAQDPGKPAAGSARVVAIADVHGAYEEFVGLLRAASLVDEQLHWSGSRSRLVIVGDVLDRGAGSRRVLELIISLEKEAMEAGGELHFVLGNHEIMNLIGDLRYVSDEEFSAYVDDEDPRLRAAALQRFQARQPDTLASAAEMEQAFNREFPPGFFGHRALFSRQGSFGSWLLGKPFVEVIDRTAFLHGGLAPAFLGLGADEINREGREILERVLGYQEQIVDAGISSGELNAFEQSQEALAAIRLLLESGEEVSAALQETAGSFSELMLTTHLFGNDGIAWYRGMVACSPVLEESRLDAALQGLGADRIVIGHTPTVGGRVLSRFAGNLIRADTGMLRAYYGGNPAAVLFEDGEVSVIYLDSAEVSVPETQPRRVGNRPAELSDDDIEVLLREAEISVKAERADGSLSLQLSGAGNAIEAIFTPATNRRRGRLFIPEVAAYRLDRMLGLDLVPVSVVRELDGVPGAVSLATDDLVDEALRVAEGLGGGAWCPLPDQFNLLLVFDSLLGAGGRSAASVRYDRDTWQLVLAGNNDILEARRNLPSHLEAVELVFPDALLEGLKALDEEGLRAAVGDVLDRSRIRALLARRDALLAKAEEGM